MRRAITATTREPRPGEIPEVHYHFWTHERFTEAISRGEMLEYAEVHGKDYYGTPRSEIDTYRAQGILVILVIDVQGAGQVRAAYPNDNVSIFVEPPAFDTLIMRLRGRGEAEESIQRRLRTATGEMARAGEFDYRVINNELQTTVDKIEHIIQSHLEPRE